ncbi:MAG TPA: DUF5329 domain-containing protein [Candidatus Aquabacterium excrementipullorum]|nr:DUF5329 domain-containing protein [Candidatus Aquabacterium excrementipullorum]
MIGCRAAEPSEATRREVAHLFRHLEQSGCQFQRNGTWYDAHQAVGHLQQKYDYLLKKGLAPTTEAFIERAGSQSSMSGKAYEVRCGQSVPVHSADWLRIELARYRQRQP